MSLDVRIGTLVFSGGGDPNALGFNIAPDGFKGWNDGVDIRRDIVENPQGHGAFDVPGFLAPRMVTIFGQCIAESEEQLGWYQAQLVGLLAAGDSKQFTVKEFGRTQWAPGRLGAKPRFEVWGGQPFADFQAQFWFAKPQKFGTAREYVGDTGEAVAAFHRGSFAAIPVMTVTGSKPSGYTIAGPSGKTYTVTKPVLAGSPHTIDMATGFLSVGGVVQSGVVTSGDTWSIPGGATVSQTLTGSGTATLTVTVKDTYI